MQHGRGAPRLPRPACGLLTNREPNDTPMYPEAALDAEDVERRRARWWHTGFGRPDEIARAVAFLASAEAPYTKWPGSDHRRRTGRRRPSLVPADRYVIHPSWLGDAAPPPRPLLLFDRSLPVLSRGGEARRQTRPRHAACDARPRRRCRFALCCPHPRPGRTGVVATDRANRRPSDARSGRDLPARNGLIGAWGNRAVFGLATPDPAESAERVLGGLLGFARKARPRR
jgi:hypothetical protein